MKFSTLASATITLLVLMGSSLNAVASIIYLSDERNITHTTEGTINPDTAFGNFTATVADINGLASASQNSSMDSLSMTGEGRNMVTEVGAWPNLIDTSSTFSVTFTVDELTDFSLSGFFDTFWISADQPYVNLYENGIDLFSLSAWDHPDAAWEQIVNFNYTGQFNVGDTYQLLLVTDGTPTTSGNNWGFNVSTVPLPASVWLFGSGLLGIIGFARRRIHTQ